jgi:hypothetical protein
MVELLLQAGANKDTRDLVSAYYVFIYSNDSRFISYLYCKQSHSTPLMAASGTKRFIALVHVLLRAGADTNAKDNVSK